MNPSIVHNSSKTQFRDLKLYTYLDKHFINYVPKNYVTTLDYFLMRVNMLECTLLWDTGM